MTGSVNRCCKCGKISHFTLKTVEVEYPREFIKDSGIIVHYTDYKPLCRKCYNKYLEELEAFKRQYFYFDEKIPFDITYRLPETYEE